MFACCEGEKNHMKPIKFNMSLEDYDLIENITFGDGPPMVLSIKGHTKQSNHCIALFQDQIIDSVDDKSFPLTRSNLDYCLGLGERFLGVSAGHAFAPKTDILNRYRSKTNNHSFKLDWEKYFSIESAKRSRGSRKRKRN